PADDSGSDHIDHRFGGRRRVSERLERMNSLLYQDLRDGYSFLCVRHLGPLLAIEVAHFIRTFHAHDGHAVRAGVRLDNDERLLFDAVFAVFFSDRGQHFIDEGRQAVLAFALLKIDVSAIAEDGVNQPRIDVQHFGKFGSDAAVMGKVVRLTPVTPAEGRWRDDRLLQAFENGRTAGRKIVIEQHQTGVEIFYSDFVADAYQSLEGNRAS